MTQKQQPLWRKKDALLREFFDAVEARDQARSNEATAQRWGGQATQQAARIADTQQQRLGAWGQRSDYLQSLQQPPAAPATAKPQTLADYAAQLQSKYAPAAPSTPSPTTPVRTVEDYARRIQAQYAPAKIPEEVGPGGRFIGSMLSSATLGLLPAPPPGQTTGEKAADFTGAVAGYLAPTNLASRAAIKVGQVAWKTIGASAARVIAKMLPKAVQPAIQSAALGAGTLGILGAGEEAIQAAKTGDFSLVDAANRTGARMVTGAKYGALMPVLGAPVERAVGRAIPQAVRDTLPAEIVKRAAGGLTTGTTVGLSAQAIPAAFDPEARKNLLKAGIMEGLDNASEEMIEAIAYSLTGQRPWAGPIQAPPRTQTQATQDTPATPMQAPTGVEVAPARPIEAPVETVPAVQQAPIVQQTLPVQQALPVQATPEQRGPNLEANDASSPPSVSSFSGFHTPTSGPNLQMDGGAGLYIALDRPFETDRATGPARRVSAQVSNTFDPDGILNPANGEVHTQIGQEMFSAMNQALRSFDRTDPFRLVQQMAQFQTDFLTERGFDSRVRLIDGELGNRELIVFDPSKVAQTDQSPVAQATSVETAAAPEAPALSDKAPPASEAVQSAKRSKYAGKVLKHFTTPESKAALEAGEAFDFEKLPQHGTGGLDLGPKTARFLGPRLYLSLDDTRWSTVRRETGEGEIVPATDETVKQGVPFFDYDKQQWMVKIGGSEEVQLEPVDYKLSPSAKVLVIDSEAALRRALAEASQITGEQVFWDQDKTWDALATRYDAVALENVRAVADKGDNQFFRAAASDQLVVLNPAAATIQVPKTRAALPQFEPVKTPQEQPPAQPRTEESAAKAIPSKEPWQMGWTEFQAAKKSALTPEQKAKWREPERVSGSKQMALNQWMDEHKTSIQQAISEGRPVPAEVLAEYQDLAARPLSTGKTAEVSPPPQAPAAEKVEPEAAVAPEQPAASEARARAVAGVTADANLAAKTSPDAHPAVSKALSELGREVDQALGDINIPIGLSVRYVGGPNTKQNNQSKTSGQGGQDQKGTGFTFSDADVEARYQASHGVRTPGFVERIREIGDAFWRKITREYEWLPRTGEFSQLRFDLKELSKQKGVAGDTTLRLQQGIAIAFKGKPELFNLFARKVQLDDLTEEAGLGHELPWGFTPENLPAERARLEAEVAKHPEVAEAVAKRHKVWEAIKTDYIAAQEAIGHKVADRFTKENYYRHQILEYAQLRALSGTGKRLKTPTGRGFLRKREGSSLDINSSYLEAEYEVMAQMLYDIKRAKVVKMVDDQYNIARDLKAQAKAMEQEAKEQGRTLKVDWHSLIPDGYTTWQPREGDLFFFADSVPARLAEKLFTGQIEELGVTADDLTKVLAKGGRLAEFAVKEEVAKTLDNLTKDRPHDPLSDAARKTMGGWKVWTLIAPHRWVKYNLVNISGDVDALFAGNPAALKRVPQAFAELSPVYIGDGTMTEEMREWFERGGMQSTLQVQELGDINKLRMFTTLMKKKGTWQEFPVKAWQSYWKVARLSTDFREAVLRYSAYLDYLEQMRTNDGRPKNFGASIPEEVMALKDIRDRAFQLSNDLLGAYDSVSVVGQWLREYLVPFWSFKEVNFRRYMQLFKNAASDGQLAATVGRTALGTLKRSPYTAMKVGSFVLKASAFWALLQAWNLLRFPDEEEDLRKDVRNTPHIIFGRDEKGNVLYLDRLGSLKDFLDWFGLGAPQQLVADWMNGRRSLKETAIEMAKVKETAIEMAKSPVNAFAQGIGPQWKLPAEMATGKRLFPNVFEPGNIRDRGLYLAQSFGMGEEYAGMTGLPRRGYPYVLSKLADIQHPGEAAYYDILDEKREFLKTLGKKSIMSGALNPKSNALYNVKLAARYGDKEAFEKYLLEYTRLGGSRESLNTSLRNLAPLSGLNDDEVKVFEAKWLDEDGRKRLDDAKRFYDEVFGTIPADKDEARSRSARWYRESVGE